MPAAAGEVAVVGAIAELEFDLGPTTLVAELDERFIEGYVPGGVAWDEHAAFPNLVDFECSSCGSTGQHKRGCAQTARAHETKEAMLLCKIEDCGNAAVAERGRYAGLCERHTQKKKAGVNAPVALAEPLADELLRQVRTVAGVEHDELAVIVAEAETAIEEAIAHASARFAALLRRGALGDSIT